MSIDAGLPTAGHAGKKTYTALFFIGLLFQITDDLLDSEKDLAEQKLTYVTYYGRERSLAFAKEAEAKALSILAPYQNEAADTLRAVIAALTNRTE